MARSLSRGSTLEYLGCFREALSVYEEALAAPDDLRSALHDVPSRTTVDEAITVASMMGALARLCRDLAEQGRRHRAGSPPTRDAVAALARFLDDAFVIDLRAPLRNWLGAYLRDRRGADWATDAHLLASGDR